MLPQRLRWLLPALIASWMHLQLGAALPAHDERGSHVSANTFDPSVATSTMIRQDYNKHGHPPDGKNNTQSSHKLVASPAGLLRPDKFQFYTYNDKGDMITRQMTVQEIQGLIAAGGADHIAMDRQEPQKAEDVLTGGKKVMDVVQKVQSVLKSALDKPPVLTGTVPKIPEQANVEWSNILPSILSGEADAISPNSEPTSHKLTTERTEAAVYVPPLNTGSIDVKKPVMHPDIQNAYGGFANNMESSERPQYIHYPQQASPTSAFSEKPMIPVPVITLTEQKLSTLQSTITESPVFQMLSVIPVDATESVHQTVTVESQPGQTEAESQTEQFVELSLSEAPGTSMSPQPTKLDLHSVNTQKQTTNLRDKVGTGAPTVTYSITTPSISTSSTVKQTLGYKGTSTPTTSSSFASNIYSTLAESVSNKKPPGGSSLMPAVTKQPSTSGMRDDERITVKITTATSKPLSHASAAPKPEETSKWHSPSTLTAFSKLETSTRPILSHTGRPSPSKVTDKLPVTSAVPIYTKDHSRPTETQASILMEPLPTQLIDSFSSVMNQITEEKPPVLSLSSTSAELPDLAMMNINYGQRHNVSNDSAKNKFTSVDTRYNMPVSPDTQKENIERIVGSQTHATVAVRPLPSLDVATRTTGYSTVKSTSTQRPTSMATDKVSAVKAGMNNASLKPSASTTSTTSMGNRVTVTSNVATTSSTLAVKSTDTTTSKSTTSSPVWVQLEKVQNVSLENLTEKPNLTTVAQKHSSEGAGGISSVTSATLEPTKLAPSRKPTPTSEYLDVTLLNFSDPVSAVDQLLSFVPLPSSTPTVVPISLPSDVSNLVASGLASGLIAGFVTSTSEKSSYEEISDSQAAKNTPSANTLRPAVSTGVTKPAESIGNVTQIHEATVDREKEGNLTYTPTPTQPALPTSPAKTTGTVELTAHTKTPNPSDKHISTTRPTTKLPSGNERIDDSTKMPSSSSSSSVGNYASVSDLKSTTGQTAITVELVTMSPQRLSTTNVGVRPLSTSKTPLHASSNQDKKDNKEKVRTTEAPIVRTNAASGSSPPVQVGSAVDGTSTRNVSSSANTGSSSKVGSSSEKNQPLASVSSTTQQSILKQHQNVVISDSKFEPHQHPNNASTNTATSSINTATTLEKNKGTTTPMVPYVTTNSRPTVTSRPVQSNKTDYNINTSSSASATHTDRPVIKVTTQTSSSSTNVKEKPTRPSLVNGTGTSKPANKPSSPSDKYVPQHTTQTIPTKTAGTSESPLKSTSPQTTNAQPGSTESKPVSLKHSENTLKPDVTRPASSVPTRPPAPKPTTSYKPLEKSDATKTEANVNTDEKWTLISQQTPPVMTKQPKPSKPPKPSRKPPTGHVPGSPNQDDNNNLRTPGSEMTTHQNDPSQTMFQSVLPLDASQSASGLDVSVKHTSSDIVNFAKLCNELAFNYWVATNKGLSTARSLALSPFGMTSLLAMIFLGARGPTSDQMNEILGLDDVATFNPHLVFQNITDTVSLARGQGIANAAFVRELFADKMKVRKLMPFYKEQAQQFYEGLVAEVNFATISDLVRRRTNLLVRKQTGGRIKDFVKTNTVPLRSPLAALSANVFQTDCNTSLTSSVGRDGELYFAVSPAVRQRRLVPVPATTWRSGVLAGYEPSIDATVVALGGSDRLVSTIFLLPGQQGHTAPGDTLDRLEQRLVRSAFRDGTWNKLLKVLIPRSGLELQIPKFSHRSVVNATAALKRMGLDELFSGNADFKGINGVGHRLHLADVLQMNLFSTCGDENILSGRHHVETYPASPLRSIRRRIEDPDGNVAEDEVPNYGDDTSSQPDHVDSLHAGRFRREKRQLSAERPRLKLDRPFLYFVRHNPSGIILHMGRFNPRLLP